MKEPPPPLPAYGNVYRPEKVDSGEGNSVTAKLLSRKLICKKLLYKARLHRKKKTVVFFFPLEE
jgi:hypothetical protein